MKKHVIVPGSVLVLILTLLWACQDKQDQTGRIVVKVTDAPFPIELIADANVTITKVEVRTAGEESEETEAEGSEDTGFITLWEGSRELELMNLRNGIMEELADAEVPAGEYDLVRVYVVSARIILNGDLGDYSVDVPSGSSSGVKLFIKPGLTVLGGLSSELLLDFSLENSFVLQGDLDPPAGIKGFNFKPVIRAVNNSVAGSIEGMVVELVDEEQVPLEGVIVTVSAKKDGEVINSTTTEADGKYVFIGMPAGTYWVSATWEDYPTVGTEVEVVSGNPTVKDFVLSPINEGTE
ncbi:MAG: DUF4382 domain-containing protein [Bacteroidales bacterium]